MKRGSRVDCRRCWHYGGNERCGEARLVRHLPDGQTENVFQPLARLARGPTGTCGREGKLFRPAVST